MYGNARIANVFVGILTFCPWGTVEGRMGLDGMRRGGVGWVGGHAEGNFRKVKNHQCFTSDFRTYAYVVASTTGKLRKRQCFSSDLQISVFTTSRHDGNVRKRQGFTSDFATLGNRESRKHKVLQAI